MERRKGCSTFPADGHQICAWFICPVINCEKQHPTTWVRYIHENAFIKKRAEDEKKKKRERLLCLKPNSTDESIKQLKLTSACYMDSINASRWSYNNSASCWWTVERRVGVPEMCCIAFEISQMHLNQISQLRKYFILIIISYSTTWVIFNFIYANSSLSECDRKKHFTTWGVFKPLTGCNRDLATAETQINIHHYFHQCVWLLDVRCFGLWQSIGEHQLKMQINYSLTISN